jgi:hypothetical protein
VNRSRLPKTGETPPPLDLARFIRSLVVGVLLFAAQVPLTSVRFLQAEQRYRFGTNGQCYPRSFLSLLGVRPVMWFMRGEIAVWIRRAALRAWWQYVGTTCIISHSTFSRILFCA